MFIKAVDKKLAEYRVVLDTPHLDAALNRSNPGAPGWQRHRDMLAIRRAR